MKRAHGKQRWRTWWRGYTTQFRRRHLITEKSGSDGTAIVTSTRHRVIHNCKTIIVDGGKCAEKSHVQRWWQIIGLQHSCSSEWIVGRRARAADVKRTERTMTADGMTLAWGLAVRVLRCTAEACNDGTTKTATTNYNGRTTHWRMRCIPVRDSVMTDDGR